MNAAHGPTHIDTGSAFYSHAHIQYLGVEAPDSRDFELSVFFHTTADFIHTALRRDCKNTESDQFSSLHDEDLLKLKKSSLSLKCLCDLQQVKCWCTVLGELAAQLRLC